MRGLFFGGAIAGRAAVFLALLSWSCGTSSSSRELVLATTTSVSNSGLLGVLLDSFRRQHGIVVRSHLVGSGLALRMLETGDADVAITHAPDAEAAALKKHPNWRYRKLMFNDFVIVGPPHDPARVRGVATPEDAMRHIAASNTRFISRGDGSGTHEREQKLWALAAAKPPTDRLVAAGSGMGATLRIASEVGAYTLTDRATLAQFAGALQLAIVFEGGLLLVNTYAATFDPSSDRAAAAEKFFVWLTGKPGHDEIAGYWIRDVQAFTPWPEQAVRDRPDGMPHR